MLDLHHRHRNEMAVIHKDADLGRRENSSGLLIFYLEPYSPLPLSDELVGVYLQV